MSFLVSTLTEGKPPLLSDAWADTYIQLYTRNNISWKGEHLAARSICVKEFAEYLRLRDSKGEISKKSGVDVQPLKSGILMHNSFFKCGDDPENWSSIDPLSFHASRLQHLVKELQWRESLGGQDAVKNSEWVVEMRTKMESKARNSGLVKGTPEWKLRWLFNCATELNLDKQTKACFARRNCHSSVILLMVSCTMSVDLLSGCTQDLPREQVLMNMPHIRDRLPVLRTTVQYGSGTENVHQTAAANYL